MRGRARFIGLTALAILVIATTGTALASPPANDARTAATPLTPPATVTGTTQGATLESDEPSSSCETPASSVWYSISAPSRNATLVLQLDANGDLDATVSLFLRSRGRLISVDCADTDTRGNADLQADIKPGQQYLVRVSQQTGSVPGSFTLGAVFAAPTESAPGRPLPRLGGTGTVDSISNSADAYSTVLRVGTTYRINLASKSCLPLELYKPGTTGDFSDAESLRSYDCGGYHIFTPSGDGDTPGGRYSFRVLAPRRGRDRVHYRLSVAPVARDDVAPGIALPSGRTLHGQIGFGADQVDIYRFGVTARSNVGIRLSGAGSAEIHTEGGGFVGSGSGETELRPGRYLLIVKPSDDKPRGAYTIRRHARVITSTSLAFSARQIAPGQSVGLTASVSHGGSGPVRINVERFDPVGGWQFQRRYTVRAVAGVARVGFLPPHAGRYRASAAFDGSSGFSPSDSRTARLTVVAPFVP